MLAKEQIEKLQNTKIEKIVKGRWVERDPEATGYGMTFEDIERKALIDWHDLTNLCDQAALAIDLVAENAELKAKLDEIWELCKNEDRLFDGNKSYILGCCHVINKLKSIIGKGE